MTERLAIAATALKPRYDAIVVGARDHAEIWTPTTWAAYRRASSTA